MLAPSSATGDHPHVSFRRWARRTLDHPDPDWATFRLNFEPPLGTITVSSNPAMIRVLLDQAREDAYRQAGILNQLAGLVAPRQQLRRAQVDRGERVIDWVSSVGPGITQVTFDEWLHDELNITLSLLRR